MDFFTKIWKFFNGYVTFTELHKIVTSPDYYKESMTHYEKVNSDLSR